MSSIDTTSTNYTAATSGTTAAAAKATLSANSRLGQDEFLQLMVAQLKNQDPTKPMDPSQFLGQLAQFSNVSQLTDLNTGVNSLGDKLSFGQVTQAAGLIDHQVLVSGSTARLSDSAPLAGAVDLSASTGSLRVQVYTSGGALVQNLDLGAQQAGLVPFSWDGTLADGSQAPAGAYVVQASYVADGKRVAADTLVAARVQSVAMGGAGDGPRLMIEDQGEIAMSAIKQVL